MKVVVSAGFLECCVNAEIEVPEVHFGGLAEAFGDARAGSHLYETGLRLIKRRLALGLGEVLESSQMFDPQPLHLRPLESRANLFAD